MKKFIVLCVVMTIIAFSGCVLAATETSTVQKIVNVAVATQTTNKIDITTKSGVAYTNCTITRVEPNGITVLHAVGIAKIPFTELPKELQAKYNYNPTNAVAYTRSVNQKQAEAEARENQQLELKKQNQQPVVNQQKQSTAKELPKKQSIVKELPTIEGQDGMIKVYDAKTGTYKTYPTKDGKIVYPRDAGDMLADIAEKKMKAKEKEKHRHIGE